MAAQYIPIKRISSLDTPIRAEKLDGSLFTTENQAHEFIISVRKNGVKQTVTGSVSGKFIRANGTTIFLQGSIVDGDAVVRLHQDCYNVQGRFTFNIFNTQSGVTTCIYSAVGKIDMGSTETVIDAGDVVPDIADVVAKQEEMTQVIADARTATTAANTAATNVGSTVARPYSPPYKAGEHCTQNGNLYKAKQDIPSDEEWTVSHWTQIVVGDEVTGLKSALAQYNSYDVLRFLPHESKTVSQVSWTWDANNETCEVNGTVQEGAQLSYNNFYHSKTAMPDGITAGQTVYVEYTTSDNNVMFEILGYISGRDSAASDKTFTTSGKYTIPENTVGIVIRLRVNSGATIDHAVVSKCKLITARSNKDLTDDAIEAQTDIVKLKNNSLTLIKTLNSSDDLDNIRDIGVYSVRSSASVPDHAPVSGVFNMLVIYGDSYTNPTRNIVNQILFQGNSIIKNRIYNNGSWSSWTDIITSNTNSYAELITNVAKLQDIVPSAVINIWDEEWITGNISDASGNLVTTGSNVCTKNLIPVESATQYYASTSDTTLRVFEYESDGTYIGYQNVSNDVFTTSENSAFIRFRTFGNYGSVYKNDLSINYPATLTKYYSTDISYIKEIASEMENLDGISTEIDNLENNAHLLLPDRYRVESERFCTAVQSHDADMRLLVYADPHNTESENWEKYQLLNEEGIFDVLAGLGDYGVYSLKRVPSQVLSDIRNNFKHILRVNNVFFVNGNHDAVPYDTNEGKIKNNPTDGPDQMTYRQLYGLYERMLNGIIHVDENDPYNPYYYVDFENAKIRMIVLNSSDIYNNDGTYTERYTNSVIFQERQLDWFANTALNFSGKDDPSNWGVIVLQHAMISYVYSGTSERSLTGYILACASLGEDIDETVQIKKKLIYDPSTQKWNRPASNDDLEIKSVAIRANMSQYGQPYIIGIVHGHNHFDFNNTFTLMRNNKTVSFPIMYFGADNATIYNPYVCTVSQLAQGWYSFESVTKNKTTGTTVTTYLNISNELSNATRLMYNDALFADSTKVLVYIFDENGKMLKSVGTMGTYPTGETVTELAFTAGRTREIDSENCYCISIDKSNKSIVIDAYGFGYTTKLNYSN